MGDQLYLERFVWFDNEARRERFPNASKLGVHFEIAPKTAQRSIDHFRDRLQAPLEYDLSHKGYFYTDPTFQLPVIRISEEELLALLISRKLITEASAGSLADELGSVSKRLGSLLAANLPGKASPEDAFSFRWKNISPTDPQTFKIVTSALLRTDIRLDHIMVQHSIVRDVLSDTLKTVYRVRKLPITDRMQKILQEVLSRTDSNFVFAASNGKPFRREPFLKAVWAKAVTSAGIDYRPPYSIRHSFAAWSLTAGVDPMRLVRLMDHGSKQMVYEVYGHYVEGLETDYWDVVTYFGRDFVEVKRRAALHTPGESCTMLQMPINKAPDMIISGNFGESYGESRGLHQL